jgi:SAM-dependent methyltransferase
MRMCEFLKSRADVAEATEFLTARGLVPHALECKNWDLAHVMADVPDGDFLDMGSSESYILHNVTRKGISGDKFGIDLRAPDHPVQGVRYSVGDIMKTGFNADAFQSITCLSVVEHNVDVRLLAPEIRRILKPGGKLYLTFDYWDPKISTAAVGTLLYGLPWFILDKAEAYNMIGIFNQSGLMLVEEPDWSAPEPVIREDYFAPLPGYRYTFGILTFKKH